MPLLSKLVFVCEHSESYMIETLENNLLSISVDSQGAELVSVKHADSGVERMWSGDKRYWDRHAPVLFPIIGSLKNNRYRVGGKSYEMSQHGFARNMGFTLLHKDATSLLYELQHSEETLAVYPFRFVFQIGYCLSGNKVSVHYSVMNPHVKQMFFSLGGHPGFACPVENGESFSDYYIEFEKKETSPRLTVENSLFTGETEQFLKDDDTINLSHKLFSDDALVFKNLKSRWIALKSAKSDRSVRVEFRGFPYLGIWSAKGKAPFLCIEPWFGLADSSDFDGDLSEKEGIESLESGKSFQCKYSLGFD